MTWKREIMKEIWFSPKILLSSWKFHWRFKISRNGDEIANLATLTHIYGFKRTNSFLFCLAFHTNIVFVLSCHLVDIVKLFFLDINPYGWRMQFSIEFGFVWTRGRLVFSDLSYVNCFSFFFKQEQYFSFCKKILIVKIIIVHLSRVFDLQFNFCQLRQ